MVADALPSGTKKIKGYQRAGATKTFLIWRNVRKFVEDVAQLFDERRGPLGAMQIECCDSAQMWR